MFKFWNFATEENGERTLRMDGPISEETWLGDEVTPAAFRAELFAAVGPLTLWLNSPGGDVFAASQIYSMLMDYPAKVTVKIDGMAASAASVIAMAGTQVLMAPTAMMMIHNPLTLAIGDSDEMKKAAAMLGEVKESIINAYEVRTKLPRQKLSNMMDAETWMSSRKAIELGFADGELEARQPEAVPKDGISATVFSRRAVTNSLLTKILQNAKDPTPAEPEKPTGTPVGLLNMRLNLFSTL